MGILSVEMQKAVIEEDKTRERIDITNEADSSEIIDSEPSNKDEPEKTSEQEADPFDGKPVDIKKMNFRSIGRSTCDITALCERK